MLPRMTYERAEARFGEGALVDQSADNGYRELPWHRDTGRARVEAPQLRNRLGILTPDELAAALDVEPQTLALWRARGVGPDFVKINGTRPIYYRDEDIKECLRLNITRCDRAAG